MPAAWGAAAAALISPSDQHRVAGNAAALRGASPAAATICILSKPCRPIRRTIFAKRSAHEVKEAEPGTWSHFEGGLHLQRGGAA